jgi:hypothetical protein
MLIRIALAAIVAADIAAIAVYKPALEPVTFEQRWSVVRPLLDRQSDSYRTPNPLYDLPKANWLANPRLGNRIAMLWTDKDWP